MVYDADEVRLKNIARECQDFLSDAQFLANQFVEESDPQNDNAKLCVDHMKDLSIELRQLEKDYSDMFDEILVGE